MATVIGKPCIRALMTTCASALSQRRDQDFAGACQFVIHGPSGRASFWVAGVPGRVEVRDTHDGDCDAVVEMTEETSERIADRARRRFDWRSVDDKQCLAITGREALLWTIVRHMFGVYWDAASGQYRSHDNQRHWVRAAALSRSVPPAVETTACVCTILESDALERSVPILGEATRSCCRRRFGLPEDGDLLHLAAENGTTLAQTLEDAARRLATASIAVPVASRLTAGVEARFCSRLAAAAIKPLLWIGSSAVTTGLHRDPYTNLNWGLLGAKSWLLIPPHQGEQVYVQGHYPGYQPCAVDPLAPDLARFPKFAEAMTMHVVVRAGQALLVPIGWFHHVSTRDTLTASLGFGFANS